MMNNRLVDSSAVILAGGKSSRMDYQCKTGLTYQGKSFIEIMLEKIEGFDEKMIVAKSIDQFSFDSVKVVTDVMPNMGPLCGLYTALISIRNDRMLVLPVDTIFINKDLIAYLIEISDGYDAVVPKEGNYYQPLCGVYSKSCIPLIEESLRNGITKPIDLYKKWNMRYVSREEVERFGSYEAIFKNINTTREYKELINKETGN
jgi:molybdopterin-guanine dinucleotide biosynthesis protein A